MFLGHLMHDFLSVRFIFMQSLTFSQVLDVHRFNVLTRRHPFSRVWNNRMTLNNNILRTTLSCRQILNDGNFD